MRHFEVGCRMMGLYPSGYHDLLGKQSFLCLQTINQLSQRCSCGMELKGVLSNAPQVGI